MWTQDMECLFDHIELQAALGTGGSWIENGLKVGRQIPEISARLDQDRTVVVRELGTQAFRLVDVHLKARDVRYAESGDEPGGLAGRAHEHQNGGLDRRQC